MSTPKKTPPRSSDPGSLPPGARWCVLKNLFEREIEDVGDAEGDFERRRVFVAFDGDDGLAGDVNEVGEGLLRHGAGGAEFADGVADGGCHALIR